LRGVSVALTREDSEVLHRPGFLRTDVTAMKILSFLSDGEVRGFNEIQRHVHVSPSTVSKFLKKWISEGKVSEVAVGKRMKNQITSQGREKLQSLNYDVTVRQNRGSARLTAKEVTIVLSISASEAASIRVTIGAKEATPDPLSPDTQKKIQEMVIQEVERVTRDVRDKFDAEYVIIESIVGSPAYLAPSGESKKEESDERSDEKTWKRQ